MLKKLAEAGLDQVVVVDLTREEIGVPVVRVIVPGLEVAGSGPGKSRQEVQECQKSFVFLGQASPGLRPRRSWRQTTGLQPSAATFITLPGGRQDHSASLDGVFFQECSVAHKEVSMLWRREQEVLGASSMGALRASELDITAWRA